MKQSSSKIPKNNVLLAPGKLPHPLLKKMLRSLKSKNPDVLLGPSVGIDAAVIKPGQRCLAVTSDPITLAGNLCAYYCIHVNANDLAVMGAVPKFMTVVGLAPPVPAKIIEHISRDLAKFAHQLGITIIGGHTEITTTVNAPILIATMFGPLAGKKIISSASAQPGDLVILTKSAALEAAAIIARERSTHLKQADFPASKIRHMQNFLFHPGISVLPEAKLALAAGCSAMHDATEGGILTALWEIAGASNLRIEIESDKIPILPETAQACRIWQINPLRAISSGSLLITISPKKSSRLLKNLSIADIPATVIGKIQKGLPTLIDTTTGKFLKPSEDEIAKIYSQDFQARRTTYEPRP